MHLSPYKQLRDTRPLLFLEGDRGCLYCTSLCTSMSFHLAGVCGPQRGQCSIAAHTGYKETCTSLWLISPQIQVFVNRGHCLTLPRVTAECKLAILSTRKQVRTSHPASSQTQVTAPLAALFTSPARWDLCFQAILLPTKILCK